MDKLGNDFEHFCSLQSHHVTTCFQINGSTYLHFSPLLVGDTPKEWAIGHTAKPPNPPSGMEARGNGVSLMVGLFREVGQKVDINFILEFEEDLSILKKKMMMIIGPLGSSKLSTSSKS